MAATRLCYIFALFIQLMLLSNGQVFPGAEHWDNITEFEVTIGGLRVFVCPNAGPIVEIGIEHRLESAGNDSNGEVIVWTFLCSGRNTEYDFAYGGVVQWKHLSLNQSAVCPSNQFLGGFYLLSSTFDSWLGLCNYLPEGWTFLPLEENCHSITTNMYPSNINQRASLLSLPLHQFIRSVSASRIFATRVLVWTMEVCAISKVQCTLPHIPHGYTSLEHREIGGIQIGSLIQRVPHGTTTAILCVPGYFVDGPTNTTCQTSGQWTELPTCIVCPSVEYCSKVICTGSDSNITQCTSCKSVTASGLSLVLTDNRRCAAPPVASPKTMLVDFSDAGETVLLPCQANGDPSPSLHWHLNGSLNPFDIERFIQVENGSLLVVNATAEDQGIYVCTAENIAGQDSAYLYLYILLPYPTSKPQIEQLPDIPVIEAPVSTDVLLDCVVDAYPPPSIRWTFQSREGLRVPLSPDGDRIQFFRNGTLGFFPIMSRDEGLYICEAENPFGYAETTYIVLVCRRENCAGYQPGSLPPGSGDDDLYSLPTILNWQESQSVIVGHPLALSCQVTGHPQPGVIWQHWPPNNTTVTNSTSGELFIPASQWEDGGEYTCVAFNIRGVDTRTLTVTVLPTESSSPTSTLIMHSVQPSTTTTSAQSEHSISEMVDRHTSSTPNTLTHDRTHTSSITGKTPARTPVLIATHVTYENAGSSAMIHFPVLLWTFTLSLIIFIISVL